MNKQTYIIGGVFVVIIIGAIIWAMGQPKTDSLSVTPPVGDSNIAVQTPEPTTPVETSPTVTPETTPIPSAVAPAPKTTPAIAGLKIEIISEGTGAVAENGKSVSVDYTGMFTDGKVFDSSIPRGEPFTITLGAGQVIKGWDLGIVGMKVGEKRRLTIAPELAYGANGFPGAIPPNSTLVFEVTLKAVK